MIYQPFRCAGNFHAALVGPAELLGRVYLDHVISFYPWTTLFFPTWVCTISAFILVLNFRNRQDQDYATLKG